MSLLVAVCMLAGLLPMTAVISAYAAEFTEYMDENGIVEAVGDNQSAAK